MMFLEAFVYFDFDDISIGFSGYLMALLLRCLADSSRLLEVTIKMGAVTESLEITKNVISSELALARPLYSQR